LSQPVDSPQSGFVIVAHNITELSSKLAGISFQEFMFQQIQFGETPPTTVHGLLADISPSTLDRMRFATGSASGEPSDKRRRAHQLKADILECFRNSGTPFLSEAVQHEDTCAVCSSASDGPLCYPVLPFWSIFPAFVKARVSNKLHFAAPFVISMRLCLHLVHSDCLRRSNRFVTCPVDRGRRAAFLPKWTGGYPERPARIQSAVTTLCADHFKEDGQLPLRSLAAEIRPPEVRQPSCPAALDDRRFLGLINGLFFAWHDAHGPSFHPRRRTAPCRL
jgi:hypothetical protein